MNNINNAASTDKSFFRGSNATGQATSIDPVHFPLWTSDHKLTERPFCKCGHHISQHRTNQEMSKAYQMFRKVVKRCFGSAGCPCTHFDSYRIVQEELDSSR